MCISHGRITASENDFQALVQLTTGTDRQSRVESKVKTNNLVAIPTWTRLKPACMVAISREQYSFLLEKRFLLEKWGRIKQFCHPTVFTKKSKIDTHVCGYTLDLTRLVCPALQSRHLITQKYCCSFFPVKIEML